MRSDQIFQLACKCLKHLLYNQVLWPVSVPAVMYRWWCPGHHRPVHSQCYQTMPAGHQWDSSVSHATGDGHPCWWSTSQYRKRTRHGQTWKGPQQVCSQCFVCSSFQSNGWKMFGTLPDFNGLILQYGDKVTISAKHSTKHYCLTPGHNYKSSHFKPTAPSWLTVHSMHALTASHPNASSFGHLSVGPVVLAMSREFQTWRRNCIPFQKGNQQEYTDAVICICWLFQTTLTQNCTHKMSGSLDRNTNGSQESPCWSCKGGFSSHHQSTCQLLTSRSVSWCSVQKIVVMLTWCCWCQSPS